MRWVREAFRLKVTLMKVVYLSLNENILLHSKESKPYLLSGKVKDEKMLAGIEAPNEYEPFVHVNDSHALFGWLLLILCS